MKKQKAQEDISKLSIDQLSWRMSDVEYTKGKGVESEEYKRLHDRWWELESENRARIFGTGKYAETKNKNGGINYPSYEKVIDKVQKADLITLPKSVVGANCFNCKYLSPKTIRNVGWCGNDKVHLKVTSKMCCNYWDNKGALRSFETKKEDGGNLINFNYNIGGL